LLSKRAESKSRIKRLKKNSDFLELRRKGLRLRATEWLQIHFQKSKEEDLYIGVTTGRKVGSAVIRNRLKRWCLEYFRKHHKELSSLSGRLNILLRPQAEGFYKEITHEELDHELQKTLSRLTPSR
jgi:ribonuclease P protein component